MAASRWGSFLTGLESKLDTILADEDPKSARQPKGNESKSEEKHQNEVTAPSGSTSRGDSRVLRVSEISMDEGANTK
jgi:hypothetical protein